MKKIASFIVTTLLAFSLVSPAFADSACPQGSFSGLCLSATQLGGVVGSFLTFAFVVVGIVALGFLIYGGFKWLTSEGDKTAVEGARNHIFAAIIGLIVIFLSYLVVNLLLGFLTGGRVDLQHITIPSLPQSQ